MADLQPPFQVPDGEPKAHVRTFAALRHRSFRLFWIGLVLSITGGWLQQVASPWLVYRLTDSALLLGLVPFLAAVPAAPLSLIAGPIVDRFPRRTVLIWTQLGMTALSIAVAVLIWTGQIQVWQIVVTEFLRGVVMAFDQPAKQVAILEMTGKEDVNSAIALWGAAVNVAQVVGPVLAGLLIESTGKSLAGAGWCFFLNGVSYLAVVAALPTMRLVAPQPAARKASLVGSLKAGLKYMVAERFLLAIASLALVARVFIRPFQTLMPIFAEDILLAGARGYGFLVAAAGVGSLLGALGAASIRPRSQRPFLLVACLLVPFASAGFAFSRAFVLSCVLLVAVGSLLTVVETLSNTIILVGAKEEFRGRVMSVYATAVMGAPRVGGFLAGGLAEKFGAPLALGASALASLIYSVPVVWLIAGGKLRSQELTPAAPEV